MTHSSSLISKLKRISLLALSLVVWSASIPAAHAQAVPSVQTDAADSADAPSDILSEPEPVKPIRIQLADITSYNSDPRQTDSTPDLCADGTKISETRDAVIAANFLPFGTKVRIPELFGDKVFVVHDRMNRRYWYRVDVWMKDIKASRQFGIHRNAKIEIVEMGDGRTVYAKRAEAQRLAKLQKLEQAKVTSVLADTKMN